MFLIDTDVKIDKILPSYAGIAQLVERYLAKV